MLSGKGAPHLEVPFLLAFRYYYLPAEPVGGFRGRTGRE